MTHSIGPETKKAQQNFTASGQPFSIDLARNIALVKWCAADANAKTKKLHPHIAAAIKKVAKEIYEGKHDHHIVVDQIQGGAGTSMNMNVNEIIWKGAKKLLKNRFSLHVNDHVNMSQSTNDVVPTALKITTLQKIDTLIIAYEKYAAAFQKKSKEFNHIVKVGRTHLQDAVPMTLGDEFGAHGSAAVADIRRLKQIKKGLLEINIGGTAVGTGINATKKYADTMVRLLSRKTGYRFKRSRDLVYATQYVDSFVEVTAMLSVLSVNIVKCMHDMRMLASGPNAGLHEIQFPEVQKGSSIMPGKINPVMSEYLNQIALQVIGNANSTALAAQAGQLELNVMFPLIVKNICDSLSWLEDGVTKFTKKALVGIVANEANINKHLENSYAILTAISKKIGYDAAAEIAKKAAKTKKSFKEIILSDKILTEKEYIEMITDRKLTKLT